MSFVKWCHVSCAWGTVKGTRSTARTVLLEGWAFGRPEPQHILVLLGCYAAWIGGYSPTFRDNRLVPS